MSEQNLEQRIADLEKTVVELKQSNLGAHEAVSGLIELNRALTILFQTVSARLYEWTVALDSRNGEAFKVIKETLPDNEARN